MGHETSNLISESIFITGTDTDVGKTWVALLLMQALKSRGLKVAAMKPIACGCEALPQGLRNDDALALMAEASVEIPYDIVNPYAFAPPIAPHIAANQAVTKIDINKIKDCYWQIKSQVDIVVVEGAGGWLVPISDTHTSADMVAACNWPVLLVVAMRLGCLNHALLSVESIRASSNELIGWVANSLGTEMQNHKQNVTYLQAKIEARLLAKIPRLTEALQGENYF
ncbi:MAG: dethiobiotin synthase [Thiohalomonadales bacterium]